MFQIKVPLRSLLLPYPVGSFLQQINVLPVGQFKTVTKPPFTLHPFLCLTYFSLYSLIRGRIEDSGALTAQQPLCCPEPRTATEGDESQPSLGSAE